MNIRSCSSTQKEGIESGVLHLQDCLRRQMPWPVLQEWLLVLDQGGITERHWIRIRSPQLNILGLLFSVYFANFIWTNMFTHCLVPVWQCLEVRGLFHFSFWTQSKPCLNKTKERRQTRKRDFFSRLLTKELFLTQYVLVMISAPSNPVPSYLPSHLDPLPFCVSENKQACKG